MKQLFLAIFLSLLYFNQSLASNKKLSTEEKVQIRQAFIIANTILCATGGCMIVSGAIAENLFPESALGRRIKIVGSTMFVGSGTFLLFLAKNNNRQVR